MAENSITPAQSAYLQSDKGREILPCWTAIQLDLREGSGHVQPNSGACMKARYNAGVQPQIVVYEDMDKPEGSLLATACKTCPIMAQAIGLFQTITLIR